MKFRAGLGKNALHGVVTTLLASLAGMLACSGTGHVVGADTAPVTGDNRQPAYSFASEIPAPEEVGGVATSCTAFALPTDASGAPTCDLLNVVASSTCDCSSPGLAPASADQLSRLLGCSYDPAACSNVCACVLLPATGASLDQCASSTPDSSATGWCYVSAEQSSDASALTSTCAHKEQHEIRFLGPEIPADTANLAVVCSGGQLPLTPHPGALGDTCVSTEETFPSFRGYDAHDINVDDHAPSCHTGVCLQNHFQGRASCPYGQSTADGSCLVAGSDVPVEGPVSPQLVDRQADVASICSCQCDGYGPGPYCSCGSGMECVHLVDQILTPPPGQKDLSGSYCIPTGSEYSNTQTTECTSGACGASHPY